MTRQHFIGLFAAVLLIGIAAVMLNQQQAGDQQLDQKGLLYPRLDEIMKNAASVTIATAGSREAVLLEKKVASWVLPQRDDYSVDHVALSQLVQDLTRARLLEKKTQLQKNYNRLGVADLTQEDNIDGVQLTIKDDRGSVLADLLCGKSADHQAGSYVRKVGDTQSWLIDRNIRPATVVTDWLDKQLIDLKGDDVEQIHYFHAGDEIVIEKSKTDGDSYELRDKKTDEQYRYQGVANTVVNALNRFALMDVKKTGGVDLTEEFRTVFDASSKLRITVRGYRDGNRYWLRLSADGSDEQSSSTAADYQQRWSPWLFEVDAHSYGELNKKRRDFIAEN